MPLAKMEIAMKTAEDIDKARAIIVGNLAKDLNPMQRAILSGVSMALCWCADADPSTHSTLDWLLEGNEPVK